MPKKRYILHIDMDAFFASVEQLDNPKLAGRPLIVGGNPQGRGVVAACSYEARKYGVRSALAAARAIRLCPQALFVPPRKERYQEISLQIMDVFKCYSSHVEPLSLDEAFLDISTDHHSMKAAALTAQHIRAQIFQEVGLSCSAGISYNKFLAKIASDMDKPNGLTVIDVPEAPQLLATLAIGKFYGVGQVTEKKMHTMGIHSGIDLLCLSRADLIRSFGKTGAFFYDSVRGIDHRPVQSHKACKSIGSETTLEDDSDDLIQIGTLLEHLARRVADRLDKKGCGGTTLTLKVRYHDFKTVTRSLTRPRPLYSFDEIIAAVPPLLAMTEAGRIKIRLLGITLSNLSHNSDKVPIQLKLPFL